MGYVLNKTHLIEYSKEANSLKRPSLSGRGVTCSRRYHTKILFFRLNPDGTDRVGGLEKRRFGAGQYKTGPVCS